MKTLDAEEIAGSFPRFLGRVVSKRESFEIVKEGVPCACFLGCGLGEEGALTPSLSHPMGEGARRAGEGGLLSMGLGCEGRKN